MATNLANKRKRDPMFAASEKMTLIELVEKYFSIVENKKTDGVTMKKKIEQWQMIANEFNAMSSIHPRDWTTLKNCWENLKKRAKQINTMRNQHFLGTGGGPPKKIIEDPAIEKVLELIKTRVTGFVNSYDSDGIHILGSGSGILNPDGDDSLNINIASGSGAQNVNLEDDNSMHINNDIDESLAQTIDSIEVAATETMDWSQYTPFMLRGPINRALTTSPRPSPDVQQELNETQEQSQTSRTANTPLRTTASSSSRVSVTASTSRRRPTIRAAVRETENLATERIKVLIDANSHAKEEHDIHMNILRLQEEREKELLAQEKIKTEQEKIKLEILKIELRKLESR